MGFLRPKVTTTAAPPPPVIEDTEAKEQEYRDTLRRRKGRASSILTSREGAGQPATASKTLMGS